MPQDHWSGKAAAIATVVATLLAVAAFFGIRTWTDWLGGDPHTVVSNEAAPAKAGPNVASDDPTLRAPSRMPITAESLGAAISFSRSLAGPDARGVTAIVTIRIRNEASNELGIVWLDATSSAFLDLDNGLRLGGSARSHFSGITNCRYSRPDRCSSGSATPLATGESQIATLELRTDVPVSGTGRVAEATKGSFTARLAVFPPGPSEPYAKSVSITDITLKNATR